MEPDPSKRTFSNIEANQREDLEQQEYEAWRSKTNIPPYWQHQRAISNASVISNGKPPPITLEDHTEGVNLQSPLWARTVNIEGYVIVSGSVKGIGEYVVWICKIDTLDVSLSTFLQTFSSKIPCHKPLYTCIHLINGHRMTSGITRYYRNLVLIATTRATRSRFTRGESTIRTIQRFMTK